MRIAMLISGGGTTMRVILRAVKSGVLSHVEPVLVIASCPDAGGIEKALAEGVAWRDVLVRDPKKYRTPESFGNAILMVCRMRGVDLVGQYGWLCKTPQNVIDAYPGMMVNQHPGPLDPGRPDFGGTGMYGRRVHCARLYFVRALGRDFFTEATAQRVAEKYDRGAVLARRCVPIYCYPRDSSEELAKRVLPVEHALQIEVLRQFSDGCVQEVTRAQPLVQEGEVPLLEEAKRVAKVLFPRG